jgi:hypothetical protein
MKHEEELIAILKKNTTLWTILEKAPSFGLKNYYIGAGRHLAKRLEFALP